MFIGGRISAGQLVAFIFYGFLTGGGVGALSEVWGDLQRAAGATERLMELLHEVPAIRATRPLSVAGPLRRSGFVPGCDISLSLAARFQGFERLLAERGQRRGRGAGRAPAAPENPPCFS